MSDYIAEGKLHSDRGAKKETTSCDGMSLAIKSSLLNP